MTEPHELLGVALVLAGWIPIALVVTARAERRHGEVRTSLPAPWRPASVCVLLIVAALFVRSAPSALACGIACISLAVAAFADARSGLLFDAITFPAAALTVFAVLWCGDVSDAARGVMVVVGGFGSVVLLSRGRWMGLGDVKAMYALGAAFGPWESAIAVFGACVSGITAVAFARRLRRGTALPFGPHLAVGAAFALIAGDPIVHRVLGL